MYSLMIFVGVVFVMQIVLFFVIRAKRRKEKESNVLLKYNISTPADAFKKMNDMSVPEQDRIEIERLYSGENNSE